MSQRLSVKCPYCGAKSLTDPFTLSPWRPTREIMICCLEDGGCDQPFVFECTASIECKTLRIEGALSVSLKIEEAKGTARKRLEIKE